MIQYSILLAIGLLIIIVLGIPIRIRYESPMLCHINWVFIKIRITLRQGSIKTDVKLFNRKSRLFTSKKSTKPKEKPSKKKKKKKKKTRKLTMSLFFEVLQDKAVKKVVRLLLYFLVRSVKAITITLLNWNIGLKDYYWQGIIFGLLQSLPRTENFQITGNFMEENDLRLDMRISILRVLFAVLLLIIRFPYIGVFLVYRRLSTQSG
ncbi:hypothetical protein KJ966_16620 [bacterium]|nr:hypothetical protein [bacterium]